jgi:hypothetical protein
VLRWFTVNLISLLFIIITHLATNTYKREFRLRNPLLYPTELRAPKLLSFCNINIFCLFCQLLKHPKHPKSIRIQHRPCFFIKIGHRENVRLPSRRLNSDNVSIREIAKETSLSCKGYKRTSVFEVNDRGRIISNLPQAEETDRRRLEKIFKLV